MRKIFNILILVFTLIISVSVCDAQEITGCNNLTVIKQFYDCSDGAKYAYVISSQYSSGEFSISNSLLYNVNSDGNNFLSKSYKYLLTQNKSGYIKLDGNEISFVEDCVCPITYLDFINYNVLTVPAGMTITIPSDAHVSLDNIVFNGINGSNYGTLINNGHIEITEDFYFFNGKFENNGILDFYRNVYFLCPYTQYNNEQVHLWKFTNKEHGKIFLLGDDTEQLHFEIGTSTCGQISFGPNDYNLLYFEEGSSLESNYYDITINTNNGETNLQTFTVKNGNVEIHIDSNAGVEAETLIVDGTITFSGGQYQSVNIEKFGMFDFVNNSSASQYLNINAAEGANIFVKQITHGTPKFTIKNKASMTLCQNPTKGVADWSGNYLATLEAGGTFNYIIDEYTINNVEYNPTNKKLFSSLNGEGDVNTPNGITIELQRYGKTIDENSGIRITSFVQFIRYIISLLSARDEQKVYLNGAFTDIEECNDAYDNHKSEILPIELVSFSFEDNTFIWQTASETNNDYFVVEYSKNGKDWTECTEHISSASDYGYTYTTVPIINTSSSVFSYFRLKQVDLNGDYSYSDVIVSENKVCDPCSEKYESNKLKVKELGNRWFRNINGELIYCEGDN